MIKELELEENPIAKKFDYKIKIIKHLSSLKKLDGIEISDTDVKILYMIGQNPL